MGYYEEANWLQFPANPLLVGLDTSASSVDSSPRSGGDLLAWHLPDVPAPGSQCLHDLGRDSRGQWHPYEDERFVDGIGQR